MVAITLRADLTRGLNNGELDANFTNLKTAVEAAALSAAWASVTGTPTTLAGYGITDAAPASHTHSYLPLSGGTLSGSVYFGSQYHYSGGSRFFTGNSNINYMFTGSSGMVWRNQADTTTIASLSDAGVFNTNGAITASSFSGSGSGLTGTAGSLSAGAVALHASNEVNIGGNLGSGSLYVNYNDGGGFTNYYFYNGNTSLASITASNFIGAGTGLTGTAASLTAGSATSTPLLANLSSYVWSASTLPTSYNSGVQSSFVRPEDGWQSYGSVMTMRTYSGGGGSLQMYVPYGPNNGGTGLQVRFGNYEVSSGNAWTGWKTLLASDNYHTYALPLGGGTMSGNIYFANDSANGVFNAAGNAGYRPDDAYGNSYMFNTAGAGGWYGDFSSYYFRSQGGSNWMTINGSVVNSLVALQQGGNQVLHAGNYNNYTASTSSTVIGSMLYAKVNGRSTSYTTAVLQLATSDGSTPGLGFHREGVSATNLYENDGELYVQAWTTRTQTGKLLSSGNYQNYSPSLTGGSAYGTWGISITGESRSLNIGGTGQYITTGAWAGTSGYHGYVYSGGNYRFGFSSSGGVIDVYADGNFYATDSSHLVLHAGNWSNYASPIWYQGWVSYPGWDANSLPESRSGFTYAVNAPFNGPLVHFGAGGYGLQLNANYGGVTDLRFRARNGDTSTWNGWRVVLSDNNYNLYSPTLTGLGASGTWGIRITGFAGAGSPRLYASDSGYSYDGSNPYYGYLTYIGSNNRWRFQVSPGTPAAVEVAYADSAGNADTLDGIDSTRFVQGSNYRKSSNDGNMNNTDTSSGFYYASNPTGSPFGDWTNWINCIGADWNPNYGFQLAHAFHSDQFAVRRVTNGSWSGWRTVLDGANYTSYLNSTYMRSNGYPTTSNDWDSMGNNYPNTVQQIMVDNFSAGTNGPNSRSYSYGTLVNFDARDNARAQMYISHAGNDLIFRGGWGTSSWQTWNRALTNQNFSNYALPLSGGTLTGNLYLGGNQVLFNNSTGARPGSSGQYIVMATSGGFYLQDGSNYYNVAHTGNFTSFTYATKAWVNFNGVGTVSIRASGGVSSITDNGVGDFTVNFSSAFADSNYATSYMGQQTATSSYSAWQHGMISNATAPTTSACRIITLNNNTWTDSPINNMKFTR